MKPRYGTGSRLRRLAAACTGLLWLPLSSSAQDFTIGVIAGLTGAGASYGKAIVQGAQMAVREANAAGGINGRKLLLKIVDDTSNPARSTVAMRRLIAASPDIIVGGWGSSQVLAHMDLVEQSEIPYIVVGATNPRIVSSDDRWIFRVIPSDSVMAKQLAIAAIDSLALKRIAVLYDSNAYGIGSRDVFVAALAQSGKSPVDVQTYQTSDVDFKKQLTAIKAARPDALAIFGTFPAAPRIMRQARDLGISARHLGTGGLASEALLQAAGAAAEGTILTAQFHEDVDAETKEWAKSYHRQFNEMNFANAVWEYNAILKIAVPCLRHSNHNRIAIRDCVSSWRGKLPGHSATVGFDALGQLQIAPTMVQVVSGRFSLLREQK